ncbi:site-specific DNA-methyltransferase [Acidimicrobiaceae bacterium USS-CC1]|uniref:Site-specific DNA-methyltransferase n=1 Tax=Acidiferrimicrobium australe TaxID=2664430 RepID=A0ABW9QQD4_9ACTN|nr:site-specific DNA-methyltransferase [Acidiferrimicrobium australe]
MRENKIDVEALRRSLGDWVDPGPERFGLTWPGKAECMRVIQEPSIGTLVPMPDESVDWDTTQNVIIEGENLEVLKLLQKAYYGKVKLIYIDPPYNTGKEFIYPDNFKEGLTDYLRYSGQVDEEGFKLSANAETDGRYHSKWLSMMYPRLFIARNLLRDDGVILVSINDREVHHLRCLLNEIFGEENFYAQFVWNNEGNVDNQSAVKTVHEYVLCYCRSKEAIGPPGVIDPNIEDASKLFRDQVENTLTKNGSKNPESTVTLPVGFPASFESGVIPARDDKWPHLLDDLVIEESALVQPCRVRSGWSSRNLLDLFISNGFVDISDSEGKATRFAVTNTGAIYVYKDRTDTESHVLSVLRNMGTTQQMSRQLASWGIEFDYPKPVYLLQYLCSLFTSPTSADIVLDFFAGAGSLPHGVLLQNVKDGGNRRYLVVQLPEPSGDGDESLASVLRRRMQSVSGQLTAAGVVEPGFRSFRLSSSNFSVWDGTTDTSEDIVSQLALAVQHVIDGAPDESMLVELLLKAGFALTAPVEAVDFAGIAGFAVSDGALLICLARSLTIEAFEAMVATEPAMILVLDAGFGGSDELKVNALQTVRARNQQSGSDIALRVV